MTTSAFDDSRVPPYVRVGAAELAAAVAERKAHTGAVASAVDLPKSVKGRKVESWQRTVMAWDQDGPGFVGWVLDTKAFLGSLVPVVVQERRPDGKWITSDEPMPNVAARQLRNDQEDTPALIERWYRTLDSVGEGWCYLGESEFGGVTVDLASINQVLWDRSDNAKTAVITTRPDQTARSADARRVPAGLMMRTWHGRTDWPDLPTSQWRRARRDVERYIATARNITRVLNSRLVTNGVLHFHVPPTAAVNPALPGAPGPVPKIVQDYATMTSRAIRNDDDEAAYAPFPVWGEQAPEWVEIGRLLDPAALEAETAALRAVGRSINFPLQLLVEGPGAGNHWSDVFLNEQFLRQDVGPGLELVLHDATLGPFRRILTALADSTGEPVDPRRWRLWYDLTEFGKRLDDTAAVVDLVMAGVISAKAARARLGLSEDEAPAATDQPPPPPAGRAGSNLLPGAPQRRGAQVAAVQTIPRADLGKVAADLNRVDTHLFLTLDGVAQRTQRAILIAAGAALLSALPRNDPERQALEQLPAERVWAAAPPELRSLVDTKAVVAPYVAESTDEGEGHLVAALAAAAAVFVAAGMVAPEWRNRQAFRDQWAAGLAATASQGLGAPPVPTEAAVNVPARWSPSAVARTSLEAAAGAVPTRDPDGRPQTVDGTWEGGSGPATGPEAIDALRVEFGDLRVEYGWHHDDPADPFVPHELLDGLTYTNDDRNDVLANLDDNGMPLEWPATVFRPGDHAGCLCTEDVRLISQGD